MLCKVWKNIGFCQFEQNFTIKNITEEEFKIALLSPEETSDLVVALSADDRDKEIDDELEERNSMYGRG